MTKLLAALLLVFGLVSVPARADSPVTYTVEPFDFDGVAGITMSITQLQFGGRYCPCVKIPYPADGLHNQQGADAIGQIRFKPGDRLMGFSLGVQVISLFLAQHTLPAGVQVLLAGDTFARNQQLVTQGQGIPWNTPNVELVVNEFDGWSDMPTRFNAGWGAAFTNAVIGTQWLHYYVNAVPDDPANVVTHQGNITAVLIPTRVLPLDPSQRALINTAYDRPGSNAAQQAAAAAQQVPHPNPPWPSKPEPAATP